MTGEPDISTTRISGWRVWPPAVLLIAIAIGQIWLAKKADLSPWKGGGFGMFATIDGSAFRRTRIFVERPDGIEEMEIAPSQESLAARARDYPSEDMLQHLARAVETRERRYGRSQEAVIIEIRRADFNDYFEATDRPLRTFTRNVEQPTDNSR